MVQSVRLIRARSEVRLLLGLLPFRDRLAGRTRGSGPRKRGSNPRPGTFCDRGVSGQARGVANAEAGVRVSPIALCRLRLVSADVVYGMQHSLGMGEDPARLRASALAIAGHVVTMWPSGEAAVCNTVQVGSAPTVVSSCGSSRVRLKGTGCNPVGTAFAGSNPASRRKCPRSHLLRRTHQDRAT